MESIEAAFTEGHYAEDFEPEKIGSLVIWDGREVEYFSCNRNYVSGGPGEFRFCLKYRPDDVEKVFFHTFNCGNCGSELVDYFDDYYVTSIKVGFPYLDPDGGMHWKTKKIAMLVFHRTCANCCFSKNSDKIFHGRRSAL